MALGVSIGQVNFQNYEPKTKFRFIFSFANTGIPEYTVKTGGRPKLSMSEYKVDYINTYRYYATKGEWEPLEIVLMDPITPSATSAVMDWVRLCQDFEAKIGGYSDIYKRDITLSMLSPANEVVEIWTLTGCWPKAMDGGSLGYADLEGATVGITLRFDNAKTE
jgi:hypothetical protein